MVGFLVAGESSVKYCNKNRNFQLCPPCLSIPQSDSLQKLSKTSPFNLGPSLIHSLIPHLISFTTIIPSYLCDSNQFAIPSDSIPQKTPSDPITDYSLPFPQQLSLSTEEQLLLIFITLIPNLFSNPVFTNRIDNNDLALIFIATKKKYKPVYLKTKPVISNLPDKFRIIRKLGRCLIVVLSLTCDWTSGDNDNSSL